MKTISILKNLITVYYYIMLFGLLGLLIGFPLTIMYSEAFKNNIIVNLPENIDLKSTKVYIIAVVFLLVYIVFVRVIWLLKNSLPDLIAGNYFSELVINNFKYIGILLLCCSIGYLINLQLANLLLLGKLKFGFDDAIFFQIIMGLFFLFLSKVFLKGKNMQEENELTI